MDIKLAHAWQREAVIAATDAQFFLNQSPGGSGKSLTHCMSGAVDIEQCGNKQLILIPQNHIHAGFCHGGGLQFRLDGDGPVRQWRVGQNFCTNSQVGKAVALRKFLLTESAVLRRRDELVAVATQAAMVFVWKTMTAAERRDAVRNTTVRIDEAHHLSGIFEEETSEFAPEERQRISDEATQLGNICQHCVNVGGSDTKVHLSTATFFRGDRRLIMSAAMRAKFTHYLLTWDEYYPSLNLDDFQFDFVQFTTHPLDLIVDRIRGEKDHRHLIILPPSNRRFRNEGTLPSLLKSIQADFHDDSILDLVTERTQEANKAMLLRHPDRFAVVVACRLFDEGTDWVPCDRMHNADACEKSMTVAVQRFFRPFRRHPNKKTVRITNYIPDFSDVADNDAKRAALSDRFNSVLATIVTNGELIPCVVPRVPAEPHEVVRGELDESGSGGKLMPLQDAYGHAAYVALVGHLIKGYEGIDEKHDPNAIVKMIERVIDQVGVPEGVDRSDLLTALESLTIRIANPEARPIRKSDLAVKGFDFASIARNGFDKVWAKQTSFDSVLSFGTSNITPATVRELLGVLERPLTLSEIHDGIKTHALQTGARLTYQTGFVEALGTTSLAIEKTLRRHHESTLAREVDRVLGDPNDYLLERTREVIKTYADRGVRLTGKFGFIPELKLTSYALNARLSYHHNTTLAAEAEKLLGPAAATIDLDQVREVIRQYASNGTVLGRKFGHIPELGITSYALNDRLTRNLGMPLAALVRETLGIVQDLSLEQVHNLIEKYDSEGRKLVRDLGTIPEVGISVNALNLRMKKFGTTLARETATLRKRRERNALR